MISWYGNKHALMAIVMMFFCTGCATTGASNGGSLSFPSWEKVGRAAAHAAVSPATWAPAAGAAIFTIGSFDRDVSRWSRDNTPLFGSEGGARRASDILAASTLVPYGVTLAALPPDSRPSKMENAVITAGALGISVGTVEALKETVTRNRPDRSGDDSFPSLHAAFAATAATAASANIDRLQVSNTTRNFADGGLATLVAATGWARIEAGKHYPSDVLAGIAIGHFLGAFVTEAFTDGKSGVSPVAEVGRDRLLIGISTNY